MDIQNNNLLFVEIKHLIQTEDMDIWNYKNELTTLIDDEIARQSVISEEVERLKEHDLYVLRDVVSGLEEEQSIDHVIARQFEKVIDEALQAYQPWIPVSERTPTESELRNGMVLAWSTELDEWQVENWGYVEDRPDDYTHWKPLPEPPKGE